MAPWSIHLLGEMLLLKLRSTMREKVCYWLQAGRALQHYGMDGVVANLLETRKEEVWILQRSNGSPQAQRLTKPVGDDFIEAALVARTVEIHQQHIHAAT